MIVYRGLVPEQLVDAALRTLHLDVAERGVDPDALRVWATTTAFPHLRYHPSILAVRDELERLAGSWISTGSWADPQIVWRLPDAAASWPLELHVDDDEGQPFASIHGVALTRATRRDGCLVVDYGGELPVELEPGDVVTLDGHEPHASTLNRGPHVRAALYFRRRSPRYDPAA